MAQSAANPADGDRGETQLTFDEFASPTLEEWRAAAIQSLKGRPFEQLLTHTYDGFDLQPIFRSADVESLSHPSTLPGLPPYVRGASASGYVTRPWLIAQQISYADPDRINEALRFDLERGQNAVAIGLDEAGRSGLDPDQAPLEQVGKDGTSLCDIADLEAALDGIDLATTPLFFHCGGLALAPIAQLIGLLQTKGPVMAQLQAGLGADPIGALAERGTLPNSLQQTYDEMAALTVWAAKNAPQVATVAVRADLINDGGGNATQELAYAMATGVAYMHALSERGLGIGTIAPRMRFTFALDADFFTTIAKLRAARLLWSQIVEAFGGDAETGKMRIDARTARRNKSSLDAHINLLRATTEALSGALGGVDSIHVAPFDAPFTAANEFSRRVARNTQLILQEETSLTNLVDPVGGSWYVEWLTDQLGRLSWSLFQEIEGRGGIVQALDDGFVQEQIEGVATERRQNLDRRKDVLVGVNMYPNQGEDAGTPSLASEDWRIERVELAAERRSNNDPLRESALQKLSQACETGADRVDQAVAAAVAGATLSQLVDALGSGEQGAATVVKPIPGRRDAAPFEALRQAMDAYSSRSGGPARIFLANMGPVEQHKARSDFSSGFFRIGGFEIISPTGFATPEDAADSALASGARAVVICSTDSAYPEIVPPLIARIKQKEATTTIILAGLPENQVDMLRAAGVDEFIHVRADCHAVNQRLQERLGVTNEGGSA